MSRLTGTLIASLSCIALSCSAFDTTPPAADSYEPDNSYTSASAGTINVRQNRSLTSGDIDWVTFTATRGKNYAFGTDGTTDTKIELFTSAGATSSYPYSEKSNDDSGDKNNAYFGWNATASGTFYLKVSAVDGDMGTYGLSIDSVGRLPTTITITSPSAGSVLYRSTSYYNYYYIYWNEGQGISDVNIFLLHGNTVVQTIASNVTNYGSYGSWTPGSSLTPDTNYRIGIADYAALYDTAYSEIFTIH